MPMSPMAPKLPAPAAFRLLTELTEFFAIPLEERRAAFDDYKSAAEQREVALLTIEEALEASTVDRALAAKMKADGVEVRRTILAEADARAIQIVDTAMAQVETINEGAREVVAAADRAVEVGDRAVEAAEEKARTLTAGLAEAEDAAKERENVAQVAALDAAASKAEYEALIRDINALQRRAPK